MNDWQKTLSEILIGCATTPSQQTLETCMKMLYTPYPQRIAEHIVDEAFEGYKNQRHALVSYCPNNLNDAQKEVIKQGISSNMENQKAMVKNILRSKGLLM